MFTFDAFNNPEPLRIFLCRPSKEIICELNAIDDQTANIDVALNDQFSLTFDYPRYFTDSDGELCESNGYHFLCAGMYLLVEKIGMFVMSQPIYSKNEDDVEVKSVSALSKDSELENKDLVGYKINTGEKDSLEMLVSYVEGEKENLINEYTDLPYDYILFYDTRADQLDNFYRNSGCPNNGTVTNSEMLGKLKNITDLIPRLKNKVTKTTNSDGKTEQSVTEYIKFTWFDNGEIQDATLYGFMDRVADLIPFYTKYRSQLSLLDLAIENSRCGWTIGYVDPVLVNKKFQFDIDSQNIYSFLREDISQKARCIIDFDVMNMKINVIAVENYGKDTGINISRQNLQNNLEVSCEENSVVTRYRVSGEDDFNISYVNFGSDRIDDISYYLNARDLNGNRIYVTDELAEKYKQFSKDREAARGKYAEYTKEYNRCLEELTELQYRVPDDKLLTDWSQFNETELNNLLDTYYNLKAQLETLYKNDYRGKYCDGIGYYVRSDDSINIDALKTTEYWYDYAAYENVIAQIKETLDKYPMYDETDKDKMNAWKTEWSLYGTIELRAKIDAYKNTLKMADESNIIEFDTNGKPIPWDNLSVAQKASYNNELGKDRYIMNFGDLDKSYNEMIAALNYLDTTLKPQEDALQKKLDEMSGKRSQIVTLVSLEGYDRLKLGEIIRIEDLPAIGTNSFTDKDREIINLLYIDADYSNENFFVTSIDDYSSTIDRQYELLDDAREQLSIDSQPQFSFSASINNLLALPDFQDFAAQFSLGNYMIAQYFDDYYVRLRLTRFSFNPRIPSSELSVEFSNFLKSRSKFDDISFLLDGGGGSGGASGRGGSGGSGGTGDGKLGDGLDITISNTLLSKLLSTEMFGTAVTNVILDTMRLNSLSAKNATFDQLVAGKVSISGRCLNTDEIASINYNYPGFNKDKPVYTIDNTEGSILKLDDGSFSFAGGLLKGYKNETGVYTLNVEGKVVATEGLIGGWTINDNSLSKSIATGGYNYTVALRTSGGELSNNISDTVRMIEVAKYTDQQDYESQFYVGSNGYLFANDANIKGTVNANTLIANDRGEIGGWAINSSGLSKKFQAKTTNYEYSVVMRTSGGATSHGIPDTIRMLEVVQNTKGQTDYKSMFYVGSDGYLFANNANIKGAIDATRVTASEEYKIYSKKYWSQAGNEGEVQAQEKVIIRAGYSGERGCIAFGNESLATDIIGSIITVTNGLRVYGALSAQSGYFTGPVELNKTTTIGNNIYFKTYNSKYSNVSLVGWSSGDNIRIGENDGTGKIIANACMIAAKNVQKWGSGGWQSLSDERYKFDFHPIDKAYDFIMGLEGCMYKFTDGTSDRYHMGFKAQATQKLMNETVGDTGLVVAYTFSEDIPVDLDNPDTYTLALRYEEFIAPHILVTQAHDREIRRLQDEIATLKTQLSDITEKLNTYKKASV